MNKKLMVVAVAGALAAPALVHAQNVQIYGRVNAGFDNYAATGATAGSGSDLKSRNRVYDWTSRIGFKGEEPLGGGLTAFFDIQSGFNSDNGTAQVGQGGQANTSTGLIGSRTVYYGLRSSWGRLTAGRPNVWWGNGRNDQTSANYISGNTVGFFSGTFPRGMSVAVTRWSNTLQYTTPTWNGFNAQISYSPGTQEAAGLGANADGKLWHITINGTVGPIMGGYDWVKRDTANSPAAGSRPTVEGNKFRIGWAYQPGAQVSLLWIRSKHSNGAPGVLNVDPTSTSLSVTAWGLSWEHVFGNIQALAQYGRSNDISGCSAIGACTNTSARQYLIGARYLFSKRTAMYLTYGSTRNDAAANQDYFGGGYSSAPTGFAANGADPRIWALGMIHNF